MLDVTLDLIIQTASASSSLLAFCFCNLIIVFILVNSKPGSEFEQEHGHTTPLSAVSTKYTNEKEAPAIPKDENCEEKKELTAVKEVSNAHNTVCSDGDDYNDDEDEEDDDELRKRVEDFIEKVNRGWKAELLKTS